jgi:catechol 2,3-dioxygenase-like lactoylglutathione lyase family enzyme
MNRKRTSQVGAIVLSLLPLCFSKPTLAQANADNPLQLSPPRTVTLVVADLDREVSWYETVLGFHDTKKFGQNERPEATDKVRRIELAGFRLDIVWHKGTTHPTPPQPFSYSTEPGWSHISFESTNLDESFKWLTAHNVEIEAARDKAGALRILRFHDPEWNEIHIELPN